MKTTTLKKAPVKARLPREEDAHPQELVEHTSVLVEEVLQGLDIHADELVLDATVGRGGHSNVILSSTKAKVLALDADRESIAATREKLAKFGDRFVAVEGNFGDVEKILRMQGVKEVNKALFDLGWNSTQLTSGRGFSFLHDEKLSMSYGKKPASGFTAKEILNQWDEKTLADVFYGYGEEQYARGIAKAIVERRAFEPIETTVELAELVRDSVPAGYRHGRIHPATKTFQALRIAVNDELGVLERGLQGVWKHLSCEGRIAVITFHSIEDRVVKHLFQGFVKDGSARLINKKPLVSNRSEIIHNPRARSAKLRVIEKICTN